MLFYNAIIIYVNRFMWNAPKGDPIYREILLHIASSSSSSSLELPDTGSRLQTNKTNCLVF